MRRIIRYAIVILLALLPGHSFAQDTPLDIVRGASDAILEKINVGDNAPPLRANQIAILITELLLPHIDDTTIARRVLLDNWNVATHQQQQRFVTEFKRYMVRFYVQVFLIYSGETVSYSMGDDKSHPDRRIVSSTISQRDGTSVKAEYLVERLSNQWKVTDIIVDGISLVRTNRSQFQHMIERDGFDKVIRVLTEHNNRPMQ